MKKYVKQKEKKDVAPGKVLESLAGSVDDVEIELEEQGIESESVFDPAAAMMKNRKSFFVIGLVVIALAVVGLVNTVKFSIATVNDIFNQTSLKNEFAEFIYPAVIVDSPAFDTVEGAPPSVIINAAIWRIILNGNTDKYENNGTYMTISEIDVESSAVSLFGYGVAIQHQTVGNGSNAFEYDAANKSYNVPVETERITYWPKVSEVSNVGERFTLTVEYMSPVMGIHQESEEQDAQKTMVYVVSRTASAMTINSISYYQTEAAEQD